MGDQREAGEHEEETVKSALWPSQAATGGINRAINTQQRMKASEGGLPAGSGSGRAQQLRLWLAGGERRFLIPIKRNLKNNVQFQELYFRD